MEKIILEQNPWWRNKEELLDDEKVKTALKKKKPLLYTFKEKQNILFIGPRQVGKTTFFKLLIYDLLFNKKIKPNKICYFSCELLKNFKEIVELFRKFSLFADPKYIFLDEISFVKDWNKSVKYLLDSNILKNKVVYLTGSSSLELKKERFPGRNIKIKYFLPLSFRDFINIFGSKQIKKEVKENQIEFKNNKEIFEKTKKLIVFKEELDKLFYKFLQSGGFPRSFYELIEKGKIKNETYEIYWNWLISDIAKLERSEKIAVGVIEGIIKNYGTKFSLSSIAKETEIGSHITVRDYLEILENLLAVRNFYNFSLSKKKVIFRKMRKTYFIDPFILYSCNFKLFGIPYDDYSKIVESIVIELLIRKFDTLRAGFYHNRKEVDLCFDDFGIEVKWQEKVDKKDFPKINIKNKILISKNEFEFIKNHNLMIVPTSVFLSLI